MNGSRSLKKKWLVACALSYLLWSAEAFTSNKDTSARQTTPIRHLNSDKQNKLSRSIIRQRDKIDTSIGDAPHTCPRQHVNRRTALANGLALPWLIPAITVAPPLPANAAITKDCIWPLWLALPVAPYARRRTIRKTIVPDQVWIFDQLIGIYYVHVPIRMTVVKQRATATKPSGLFVYAPVAPTRECLSLLQELVDQHGPVRTILLPSVAVEHKVNAGPFARQFPDADFYVVDRQYSFPLPLPDSFLGLPSWTQRWPSNGSDDDSDNIANAILGPDFSVAVLSVQPGPKSQYQDVAVIHRPSRTMLVCDAILSTTVEPPAILTEEPEYTRALLFHARDQPDDVVEDTPENRRKGWRRIVLLFNFFFPGSGQGDLGPGPILQALTTPLYKDGWGGWMPFTWGDTETKDFDVFSAKGKPAILPIIQIILARGPDQVNEWVDTIATWKFDKVIPAHLDAPLAIGPTEFAQAFEFARTGRNEVRFCDEDVAFLRAAEEGPLSFSVYKSSLGTLHGVNGRCGLVRAGPGPYG